MPRISPKTGFFNFCQNINPFMFLFFYPKMVTKRVLCDSPKCTCLEKSGSELLSANHIAVFFDHQYLWKKSSDILVIFHGVGLQAKASSEKVVAWLAVTRFAFHVIRLHDSLVINILGENQLIS